MGNALFPSLALPIEGKSDKKSSKKVLAYLYKSTELQCDENEIVSLVNKDFNGNAWFPWLALFSQKYGAWLVKT
jgi:hypothetical protein